ncbi:hypothetical protein CSA57_00030 [candidate division KSB3 bacterium]|nr:MAG: hypothetical protein CSA57_00030 [candidate division KSB3 bacterium]
MYFQGIPYFFAAAIFLPLKCIVRINKADNKRLNIEVFQSAYYMVLEFRDNIASRNSSKRNIEAIEF